LRAACDLLPLDGLLLGWDLPAALLDVCQDETARAGIKLYRWQPLLAGDGVFVPKTEWQTRNWRGIPLPGFGSLPEFTFVCPNHPVARQAALSRLAEAAQSGRYAGIFLDRMRWPSPAADPVEHLACFCEHCQRAAAGAGLDLGAVRQTLSQTEKLDLLRLLWGESSPADRQPLDSFLAERQRSLTQFVGEAVRLIRAAGLEAGLDCFSPSLTRLVGQDLAALSPLADWTKIMTYAHAFGPATLPFELTGLAGWLVEAGNLPEPQALEELSEIAAFPLPTSLAALRAHGLPAAALAAEYERGRQSAGNGPLLAGIELVEMPGVCELNAGQIEADLRALKAAGASGLALSWDLWRMPLDRLETVRSAWFA